MKDLIKKLKECTTLGQADPILQELNAGTAVKKLVETAIILNNSKDPAQKTHAFSFMDAAIKEIESRNKGSHQESPSYEPKKAILPKGGMQGAIDTQNQMTGGEFAQIITTQSKNYLNNYHETYVKPMVDNFKKEMDSQTITQEEIDDDIATLNQKNQELKNDSTALNIAGVTESIRRDNMIKEIAGFAGVTTAITVNPYWDDWQQQQTPDVMYSPPFPKDMYPLQTARREMDIMDKKLKQDRIQSQ